MKKTIDKPFLWIIALLMLSGIFIFSSAALGLLARSTEQAANVATNQFLFGIIFGTGMLFGALHVPYKFWRRYSLALFVGSLILTAAVFIPGLGLNHGGATRWIEIGSFSFQPSELLKFGFVVYLAAWLSAAKERIGTLRYGVIPLGIMLALIGAILLKQPDTGTFAVIFITGLGMLVASGGKWRHVGGLVLIACIGLLLLALFKPYIKDRITTFFNPGNDPQGSSYQIRQSLIAVGSGELFGRGFGQSVQKFRYLPEPVGDSIFAVAAEEFGFVGSVGLVLLFLLFALRGFIIAERAPDYFSRLLVAGIVILITVQSYTNIAAMLGVFPLTGLPLIFISHGGTAMLVSLAEVGVVLHISRYVNS
ncbi:MAG: cell division protein FtsW [Parcubacteria group bacterium]|nr:cell division protein FtsW [Parcubacteria group bacterium]